MTAGRLGTALAVLAWCAAAQAMPGPKSEAPTAVPQQTAFPCPLGLESARGWTGAPLTCSCSAEAATDADADVWGTDIYTDDSHVCRAAVHAGVIGRGGGVVTVRPVPGRTDYPGTARNGVRTLDYGPWDGSYRFDGGPGGR